MPSHTLEILIGFGVFSVNLVILIVLLSPLLARAGLTINPFFPAAVGGVLLLVPEWYLVAHLAGWNRKRRVR